MNHRNRTVSYVILGFIFSLQMYGADRHWLLWALMALICTIYPQVARWQAVRASDQLQGEFRNLWADCIIFGGWAAALHFPLWPGFMLFTGCSLNTTLFRGWRGFGEGVGLWLAGAAVTSLFTGWRLQPDTSWGVTAVSIGLLSGYLTVSSVEAYRRSMLLHSARERLRRDEQELQRQLEEIEGLQAQLREQAIRDGLTGLYNRRHLDEALAREMNRSRREGAPMAVLLVDVDHFKRINDTLGHQAGDEVLRQMAGRLARSSRGGDLVFRYGGEEFLLALPHADGEAALRKAEALRQACSDTPIKLGEDTLRITVSVGVSVFPACGDSMETLIRAADEALYRAKHQGRNRVCVGPTDR